MEEHKYDDAVMEWVRDLLDVTGNIAEGFVDILQPIDYPALFAYNPWTSSAHTNLMFAFNILRTAGVRVPLVTNYVRGLVGDHKTLGAHAAMLRAHFVRGNKQLLQAWVANYAR